MWITTVCLPVTLEDKNCVPWKKIASSDCNSNQTRALPQEWDCISICSKTGHLIILQHSFLGLFHFYPLCYLHTCLTAFVSSLTVDPMSFSSLYSPQCSVVTVTEWINILSSQRDCKDIENRNSVLFFFESPAPKTGSWAQQSTTVVVYDNQVYYVYYIKMAGNNLSNNYSLSFFFQYLL